MTWQFVKRDQEYHGFAGRIYVGKIYESGGVFRFECILEGYSDTSSHSSLKDAKSYAEDQVGYLFSESNYELRLK